MHRDTNIEASRSAPLPSNTKRNLKNIKCRYLNTYKCNSSLSTLKCPDCLMILSIQKTKLSITRLSLIEITSGECGNF